MSWRAVAMVKAGSFFQWDNKNWSTPAWFDTIPTLVSSGNAASEIILLFISLPSCCQMQLKCNRDIRKHQAFRSLQHPWTQAGGSPPSTCHHREGSSPGSAWPPPWGEQGAGTARVPCAAALGLPSSLPALTASPGSVQVLLPAPHPHTWRGLLPLFRPRCWNNDSAPTCAYMHHLKLPGLYFSLHTVCSSVWSLESSEGKKMNSSEARRARVCTLRKLRQANLPLHIEWGDYHNDFTREKKQQPSNNNKTKCGRAFRMT